MLVADATWRRTARLGLHLLAALLALSAAHALVGFDVGPLQAFVERWAYNVVLAGGGLACLVRAVAVPAERRAWLVLGASLLCWTAGNVYYTAVLFDLATIPVPSPADYLWLVFYVGACGGVVTLLRSRAQTPAGTLWLDCAIGALAVGAVGAAVVFEPVLRSTDGLSLPVAVNLAYPLADVLLLALITGVVALTGWKPGRTWWLIALGFIAFGVCDSIYLAGTANGSWHPGNVFEGGWPLGFLLVGYAALQSPGAARPARIDGWRTLVLPSVFATGGLAVLAYDHVHRVNGLSFALATATLVAVIARLALTLAENARRLKVSRSEALTDALTGLGNRRRLIDELERRFAEGGRALLVLCDLNGFKAYNDRFGHPAGDALLRRLAARLTAAIAPGASAHRMGGDEFCVIAPLAGGDDAGTGVVPAVSTALSESGEAFAVSAAHGAVVIPDEAADPAEALGVADRRMYEGKHRGRTSAAQQATDALLQALYEHNGELGDHVHDVTELVEPVARALGLSGAPLTDVLRAAALHDVGKVAIPNTILDKPGPLDEDEWAFMRRHTLIGARILHAAPALAPAAQLVRSSHERWDGRGYPDALAADDIPLGARIIAVCDAFDAMTSERRYQPRGTTGAALAELRRCAGEQFDPRVVDAFCAVMCRAPARLAA